MRIPKYYFSGDFRAFAAYFHSQPHEARTYSKGAGLWLPEEPHQNIHYIESGLAMHYALHENGRRKIISFHGEGTVFPGYHQLDFKIERALVTEALSGMTVLSFTKAQFQQMFETNTALAETVVNWYAAYVNMFLFETVHQDYNSAPVKLANLLYLLALNQPAAPNVWNLSQEALAELLGMSRVQLSRALGTLRAEGLITTNRGHISITDLEALAARCSSETQCD